jgi:hypothetical protein
MNQKQETYYNLILKNFKEAEKLIDFLNQPEILRKWDDADRETFATHWLTQNNFKEVNPNDELAEVSEVFELELVNEAIAEPEPEPEPAVHAEPGFKRRQRIPKK